MTLKSFRNTANITMKALSEKTGIGVSTLYAYEKENALPNREVALKLAAAYGMSFRDLEALVKNEKGVTRAQFQEQAAENFRAKFKPDSTISQAKETPKPQAKEAPKSEPKPTPQAEAAPESKPTPTTQTEKPHEPDPRKEEVREPVIQETAPEPMTPQVKTATDAEYLEAVSGAVKALRAILGADNNGMIMLAVGFVTAEIEAKLFVER